MKNKLTAFFVAGIGVGIALGGYFVFKHLARRNRAANLHLTNKDLDYSNVSPVELEAGHLVDLNSADIEQLKSLGLNAESADRLIENRPYRNKLDLLSRMVISQGTYTAIKEIRRSGGSRADKDRLGSGSNRQRIELGLPNGSKYGLRQIDRTFVVHAF